MSMGDIFTTTCQDLGTRPSVESAFCTSFTTYVGSTVDQPFDEDATYRGTRHRLLPRAATDYD